MKKLFVFVLPILVLTSNAFAEQFVCDGSGKFNSVSKQSISIRYVSSKPEELVLMENDKHRVAFGLWKDSYSYIAVTDKKTNIMTVAQGLASAEIAYLEYTDPGVHTVKCYPQP